MNKEEITKEAVDLLLEFERVCNDATIVAILAALSIMTVKVLRKAPFYAQVKLLDDFIKTIIDDLMDGKKEL